MNLLRHFLHPLFLIFFVNLYLHSADVLLELLNLYVYSPNIPPLYTVLTFHVFFGRHPSILNFYLFTTFFLTWATANYTISPFWRISFTYTARFFYISLKDFLYVSNALLNMFFIFFSCPKILDSYTMPLYTMSLPPSYKFNFYHCLFSCFMLNRSL